MFGIHEESVEDDFGGVVMVKEKAVVESGSEGFDFGLVASPSF